MEPIIYFFGTLPGGFSSYPQDHTRVFFEQILKRVKYNLQIVVLRKDNLLYYGYVRKFNGNYFGICICVDRILNDVNVLFDILDDVFASMIEKGDILMMTSETNVEWAVRSYTSESVAINEYKKLIAGRLYIMDVNSQRLPPADFSISINDVLEISLEASKEEIIDATKRYSKLCIVKNNAEIERVVGFAHLINLKNQEIEELNHEIAYWRRKYQREKGLQSQGIDEVEPRKKEKKNISDNRRKSKQGLIWKIMLGVIIPPIPFLFYLVFSLVFLDNCSGGLSVCFADVDSCSNYAEVVEEEVIDTIEIESLTDISECPNSKCSDIQMDEDCGLEIFQNGKFVDDGDIIDMDEDLFIYVKKEREDYKLYIKNLKNENWARECIMEHRPVRLVHKYLDPKSPIIITYWSSGRYPNPRNQILLRIDRKNKHKCKLERIYSIDSIRVRI